MSVPSLLSMCAKQIAQNQDLFLEPDPDKSLLPLDLFEMIKYESCIKDWRWHVTVEGKKKEERVESKEEERKEAQELPQQFQLTAKTYDDFSVLYPRYDVEKENYLLNKFDQLDHSYHFIQTVIDFVKEKGMITGCASETRCYTENHQRFLSLYHYIPTHERVTGIFNSASVRIAEIEFPCKKRHTVKIDISDLSKINENLKTKWSKKTYDKLNVFVVYYINQLAIDNKNSPFFSTSCTKTDNRLFLAKTKTKNDYEVIEYLFGKKDQSCESWLLNDHTFIDK